MGRAYRAGEPCRVEYIFYNASTNIQANDPATREPWSQEQRASLALFNSKAASKVFHKYGSGKQSCWRRARGVGIDLGTLVQARTYHVRVEFKSVSTDDVILNGVEHRGLCSDPEQVTLTYTVGKFAMARWCL
jgi:hypothetical protein